MVKFYLIVIWSDIEPQLGGPFDNPEDRDDRAREVRENNGDEHGIYWLNVDGEELEIGAYSGSFFMKEDE